MENLILNSEWEALFRMNHPEIFNTTAAKGAAVNTTNIVTPPPSSPTFIDADTNNSGKVLLQILFLVGTCWVIYEIIKTSYQRKPENDNINSRNLKAYPR